MLRKMVEAIDVLKSSSSDDEEKRVKPIFDIAKKNVDRELCKKGKR